MDENLGLPRSIALYLARELCHLSESKRAYAVAVRLGLSSRIMTMISENRAGHSSGDPLPPKCTVIQVHVSELKQLFNSIDPSPFRNKDLDPRAEEFIVGWAKDMPLNAPLGLVVDLDRPAGLADEAAVLRDAIHVVLPPARQCVSPATTGVISRGPHEPVIGLFALAAAIALGDFVAC